MKTTKRVLSMVLALMMFFSLSVTAFADTVVKAPDIKVNVATSRVGAGTSWTVEANVGQNVCAAIKADTKHVSKWDDKVKDYYNPSKLHSALLSYGGFATTKFDKNIAADVANLVSHSNYNESQIAAMTWYTGNYQGYGLVGYDEDTGEYSYIYAGYDWTYSSDKNPQIWDYMCCYNIKDGEAVTLVYDFTVSEWTTDTPLVKTAA